MDFWTSLLAIQALAFFSYLYVGLKKNLIPVTRRHVIVFGALWVILASSEFWILGPYSYSSLNGDIDTMLLDIFINQQYDGGLFSHAFAGGNDIYALTLQTGQYYSLERILFSGLGVWGAIFTHKILLFAIGFSGAYLLCKRVAKADRGSSAALAAIFTLSHQRLVVMTWGHGLGFALIPLAVYMCVGRIGRRHYYPGVLLIAALNAISSSPTHSNLALFIALGLSAILLNITRLFQFFSSLFIVAAALLLNWHESLYAKAILAPYSFRGTDVVVANEGFLKTLNFGITGANNSWITYTLILLGLVLLAKNSRQYFIRASLVVAATFLLGSLTDILPWDAIGLGFLKGVHFTNMDTAIYTIAIIVCSLGISKYGHKEINIAGAGFSKIPRKRIIATFLLALAVGKFFWYKTYNAANWLSEGGMSIVNEEMANLKDRRWLGDDPVRVVSVPYRLSPAIAVASGLDTFDGVFHLQNRPLAWFWQKALGTSLGTIKAGSFKLNIGDPKCCNEYNLSNKLNLDFLRIANVGYVLSILPLYGDGIVQVAGPSGGNVVPRVTTPISRRIGGYIRQIFNPASIRVYALRSPLPRVYAANSIFRVPDGVSFDKLYQLVGKKALSKTAIVSQGVFSADKRIKVGLAVKDFSLTRDGFEVSVEAPTEGILVFNTPYLRYWHAYVDNRRVDVFPVNGFQTGALIPVGAKKIFMRYERPLLKDKFFTSFLGR